MRKLLFILLLITMTVNGRDTINNNQIKIVLIQSEINHLHKRFDDYQQYNNELLNAKKDEIEKLMQEKEDALDTRMIMYVSFFIAALVTVFGFFKWLGKGEIRRIVNEQSVKQIDEQLEVKLSAKVIDEKLNQLGKPIIEQMLKEISESKQKAQANIDELEKSNKKYKKLLAELGSSVIETDKEFSQSTPEEKAKIKEFNEVLEKVKTEEEFTQRDWSLKAKEAFDNYDNQKAIEFYSKSINIDPKTEEAYNSLFYRALAHHRLNQYNEALKDGLQALEIMQTPSMLLNVSTSYEYLNDYNQALKYINQAIEKDPDYEHAIEVRDSIVKKMNK